MVYVTSPSRHAVARESLAFAQSSCLSTGTFAPPWEPGFLRAPLNFPSSIRGRNPGTERTVGRGEKGRTKTGVFERACSEGSHPFLGKPSSPPDSVRRGLSGDGSRSAERCRVRFHVWAE